MTHSLKFEKKPIDPFARRDNIDDYVVIDPRVRQFFVLFFSFVLLELRPTSHNFLCSWRRRRTPRGRVTSEARKMTTFERKQIKRRPRSFFLFFSFLCPQYPCGITTEISSPGMPMTGL